MIGNSIILPDGAAIKPRIPAANCVKLDVTTRTRITHHEDWVCFSQEIALIRLEFDLWHLSKFQQRHYNVHLQ